MKEAAEKGDIIFSMPGVLYGGEAPLLGLPCEELTPELLADRLGGILDGYGTEDRDGDTPGDPGAEQRKGIPESTGATGEVSRAGGAAADFRSHAGELGDGDGGLKGGADLLEFPQRRTDKAGRVAGLSLKDTEEELEESKRDLVAFQGAYNVIKERVQEVKDEHRMLKLVDWSGTAAVIGTLELTIHAVEMTVAELEDIRRRIINGVIPNLDRQ